jgi:hypothetical protein
MLYILRDLYLILLEFSMLISSCRFLSENLREMQVKFEHCKLIMKNLISCRHLSHVRRFIFVVVGFPTSAEAKLDGKTGTLPTIYFRYFIEHIPH